jgi:prophage regulatory protein
MTDEMNSVRIIRLSDVAEKLSISRSKLFDMIAKGFFPQPFSLIPGGRAVGFLESDVNQWILDRKAAAEKERDDT